MNQKIETGMKMANSNLVQLSTASDKQGASQNQSSGDKGSEKMHDGWSIQGEGGGEVRNIGVDDNEMIVQWYWIFMLIVLTLWEQHDNMWHSKLLSDQGQPCMEVCQCGDWSDDRWQLSVLWYNPKKGRLNMKLDLGMLVLPGSWL